MTLFERVNDIQSQQVAATTKHYIGNDQEYVYLSALSYPFAFSFPFLWDMEPWRYDIRNVWRELSLSPLFLSSGIRRYLTVNSGTSALESVWRSTSALNMSCTVSPPTSPTLIFLFSLITI
jgi:hypothetical protein